MFYLNFGFINHKMITNIIFKIKAIKINYNKLNKLINYFNNRAKKLKSIKEDSEADLKEFREIQDR